jgi:hypothetical protein
MNDLAAIAYTSKAARPLGVRDLDGLLMDARAFNESAGVSGVLLHHQGTFFQYFEGPPGGVARVYARIRRSSMHEHLAELLNQPTDARQFVQWHMAFAETPLTLLDQLSNEYWAMALPALRARQTSSPGLKLLLDFWNATQRG